MASHELSRASHDFCRITDELPGIVFVKARDGAILYLNGQGHDFFGASSTSHDGWSWPDLVHPEDRERAERCWRRATTEVAAYELEVRVRDGRGEYHWVTSRGTPVHAGGHDTRWVGTITLIDDVRRFEQQVRVSDLEHRKAITLLDALQSAPAGFLFLDAELRVLRINDAAARLLDGSPDELVGRTIPEIDPEAWVRIEPLYARLAATGEPLVGAELVVHSSDESVGEREALISAHPVRVDGELCGYGVVLLDITERNRAERARQALTHSIIDALARTVETRDPYTAGHQGRVALIAEAIAEELGLRPDEIEGIRVAAHIHDVGKIAVPAEILSKPSRLTTAEFEIIKAHSRAGHEIVKDIEFGWPVAEMVLQHHERLDGSGYPAGLSGERIVTGARIIAVADVVEAMATHRPYRPARGLEVALREVAGGSGRLYDGDAVRACLRAFETGRVRLDADVLSQRPRMLAEL
ncbi:MAG TPA: HD domain-containing phosphohydrolase [Acidimicrobiales bacterium]|nr:HD domain-containing phosphohydrolase [Acidimicrobiales bacterium]